MPDATTDPEILAKSAYAGDRHLAARQSLYQYQQPHHDIPAIVSQLVASHTPTPEVVLDLGCGNGTVLQRMRFDFADSTVIGADLSTGMLAPLRSPLLQADAQHLPMGDNTADVVLAMHMLYHLADIPAAIAQIHRVLKPGGLLIVSTNADDDKAELGDLWSRAAGRALGVERGPKRLALSERFRLEDTEAVLRDRFDLLDVVHLRGTITVAEPEPILAHFRSYGAFAAQMGIPFDSTISAAGDILGRDLHDHGTFTITAHSGMVAARRLGSSNSSKREGHTSE